MNINNVIIACVCSAIFSQCDAKLQGDDFQKLPIDSDLSQNNYMSFKDTVESLNNANIPVSRESLEKNVIKVDITNHETLCYIFYALYDAIKDAKFDSNSDFEKFNALVLEQIDNIIIILASDKSSIRENPMLYRNIINKCFYIEQELLKKNRNYTDNPLYKTTFLLRKFMQMFVAYECARIFSENNRSEIAKYLAGGMSFYGDVGTSVPVDVFGTIGLGGNVTAKHGIRRSNVGASKFTKVSFGSKVNVNNSAIGGAKVTGTLEGEKSKKSIGLAASTNLNGIASDSKHALRKTLSSKFMKYKNLVSMYNHCIENKSAYIIELQNIFNKYFMTNNGNKIKKINNKSSNVLDSHMSQQLLIAIVNEFMYKEKCLFDLDFTNTASEDNPTFINIFKQLDTKVYADAEQRVINFIESKNTPKKKSDLINGFISLLLSNEKNIIDIYFKQILDNANVISSSSKKLKKIINNKQLNYSNLPIAIVEKDNQKVETYINTTNESIKDVYDDFKEIDPEKGITNYFSNIADIYCFLLMLADLKQIPDVLLSSYDSLLNLLKITLDKDNLNTMITKVENIISQTDRDNDGEDNKKKN